MGPDENRSSGAALRRGRGSRLAIDDVTIGYDARIISEHLTLEIPDNSFTVIVGPNACGKSTLLRACARVLKPQRGQVILDGREIAHYKAKDVAQRLGLLPQTALAPDGIRVAALVARGRYPHQGFLQQWRDDDEKAVTRALAATRVTDLSGRLVDELSGGQRQRVWLSMLLAQETPLMLLDEPTTFLDIAHQHELLELLDGFNRGGKTVVAVLHDLNQAARYASYLVVMKDGRIVTTGAPADILTEQLVEEVFGLRCLVAPDPVTGTPAVFPLRKERR
ncbi:ABC transporter ATP-binding protein [Tsukamurella sp. 8F]|uniref:ABC transporter ATP-binding protein n=1 Tax=unclassified Tsukamurella TaxID=2633480 RepID=UPI0023BA2ECD|nr:MULTISPECIES: ABC transporter ATP-binding protein [unclassified Tsukamurella]MDF0531170.1 ABC transporter ATP-binding protein [Tsukamurella sp. 8J]MDF0585883.1 ABC transporter ATP-binding protein [Tsukamurella sp. 8F]